MFSSARRLIRSIVPMSIGRALGWGTGGFNPKHMSYDPVDPREWECSDGRMQRYRINWGWYDGSIYDDCRQLFKDYRRHHTMYRWSRPILNRSAQIGEFYGLHVVGGKLDPEAGDGSATPSAIPIVVPNSVPADKALALRKFISRFWLDSAMEVQKDLLGRIGAVKGDVYARLDDQADAGRIVFRVVQPESISYYDEDDDGNCRCYVYREMRPDPEFDPTRDVTQIYVEYVEVATRVDLPGGGRVVRYQTQLNGIAYDWRGGGGYESADSAWEVEYDFIPMYLIRHIDIGSRFGMAEVHALHQSRFREVDDVGSCLTDQARKQLNGPWAVNSRKPSDLTDKKPGAPSRSPTGEFHGEPPSIPPDEGRDKLQIKWIDKDDLKVVHMVGDMNVDGIIKHGDRIQAVIESDFPELIAETAMANDTSGRAIRSIKAKAAKKVRARRVAYDFAIVRAHRDALRIGVLRGYEAAADFDDADFPANVQHSIGDRPVFDDDPLDKNEEELSYWNAAMAAVNAGVPILVWLKWQGWADEDIDFAKAAIAEQQAKDLATQKELQASKQPDNGAVQRQGGNPSKPKEMTIAPPDGRDPSKPNP